MSDEVVGCGDSGCVFGRGTGTRYGGQHTNGGCRCLEDDRTGRQFSFETKRRLRESIRALRKQLDEARAEVERLRFAHERTCARSGCNRSAGAGPCANDMLGACVDCCPMHRCGGEA